jgi:hypothetical protein
LRECGNGVLVRAILPDGVSGSFRAEKDTRSEALRLAKTLREEGSWVIVTKGSIIELIAEGQSREFYYMEPRSGLTDVGVKPGIKSGR